MFTTTTTAMQAERLDSLPRADLADRVESVRRLKAAAAAYEHRLIAAIDGLGDAGLDGAGVLRVAGRMSSRAAGDVARTAGQLAEMPRASEALASGRITAEHAATLADAAEKTDATKVDRELVPTAAAVPADVLAKRSRTWVDQQRSNDDLEDEQTRLRRQRSGRHHTRRDKMGVWVLELDPVTDRSVSTAIKALVSSMWRDDSADDTDPATVRTPEQRLADAFVQLVTDPSGSDSPRHPKYQLAAVFDTRRMADCPTGEAMCIDGQALPQSVLEQMACDAAITPMIFGSDGRPLWVGRDHRTATVAQWKALIARDRGCIGCGADPLRCEAHHIVAWEFFGLTDIDNLTLLCSRCHHDVHKRGMEVVQTTQGLALRPRGQPAATGSKTKQPNAPPAFGLFA